MSNNDEPALELTTSGSGRPLPGKDREPGVRTRVYNRVGIALMHSTRYAFSGQARLAADAGVSRSTISRLVNGRTSPSFALVQAVTRALERDLGRRLDPRELFSPDGTYPTRSGCAAFGCVSGCFPEEAYDRHGNLRPAFQNLRPGDWSLAPILPTSAA
jgi:DNA-binding XRE family transcriptional regulator